MEVSVSTGMYYKKSGTEILDIIKGAGCDNIELFINQAFFNFSNAELEKEISKRNMKVSSIHLPIPIIYRAGENEQEWIKKGIEIAKLFDTKYIVTHTTYETKSDGSVLDIDLVHLNNLKKYSGNDRYILTENNSILPVKSFTQGADEFCDILEKNNLSMTFDTTHWAFTNRPLSEGYNLFKKYIKNIHISDYRDKIEHVAFGDGDLDLGGFIKKLKKDNYNYLLTVEYDFDNIKRNNIRNNNEAIEKIAEAISYINQV